MILLIDNYDSFTYNLLQYMGEFNPDIRVVRNDAIDIAGIEDLAPSHLVISPGPCSPNEAGCSVEVSRYFSGKIPVLGICLGHQSIGQAFGARIIRAKEVVHGKTSRISHDAAGIFEGVEPHFIATRYHSLVIDPSSVPECLEVLAWSDSVDGSPQHNEIMAIRHRQHPHTIGLQFHPESILTSVGKQLLSSFLALR